MKKRVMRRRELEPDQKARAQMLQDLERMKREELLLKRTNLEGGIHFSGILYLPLLRLQRIEEGVLYLNNLILTKIIIKN